MYAGEFRESLITEFSGRFSETRTPLIDAAMHNQPLEEHAFYAGLTHYGRTALFITIENGATDLPGWLIDAEAAISGHSAWNNENKTDNINVL